MSRRRETTLTNELVNILRDMRSTWNIETEVNAFTEGNQELDALVTERGREPIGIEAKFQSTTNTRNLLTQAESRLVHELEAEYCTLGDTLNNVMAIMYPERFRTVPGRDIRMRLLGAKDLHYKLVSVEGQFPQSGWAIGTAADVAHALIVGAVPSSHLEQAAAELERSINRAAILLADAVAAHPAIGTNIETLLHQAVFSRDENTGEETFHQQTLRMAALIITNAFVFQSSLAGTTEMESVHSLGQLLSKRRALERMSTERGGRRRTRPTERGVDYADVIADWHTILSVNYRPIFADARTLVEALAIDDKMVQRILSPLCEAARELVDTGIAQIHELAGMVFQRLIVDRRYLKANYTLPESAALLSALVVPEIQKGTLPKVGDFSCGTGALLHGVYQRILFLYEKQGGNGRDIHRRMLENCLSGADVLPNATHFTAAALAGTQPDIRIRGTRILTAPYGLQDNGDYALGSLELLDDISLLGSEAEQIGGEENLVVDLQRAFEHGDFDVVIQNPPFTKPNADANADDNKGLFRGTGRPEEDMRAMRAALQSKDRRIAHGMAGLSSYFVDLADKKLKRGGTMGFILPATILAATSMQKARDMWATEYHNVTVITIAQAKGSDCAFSADTSMAECMVIATKGVGENTGRGTFVCLKQRPESQLEAIAIANRIHHIGKVRRMEDAPSGGNPIRVGDDTRGQVLECPLPPGEGWSTARVQAMALVQAGYRLSRGKIWTPTQTTSREEIPMCSVGDMAILSMSPLDMYGDGGRGAFDMAEECSDTDDYPCLWQVHSPTQRTMVSLPDAHGILRPGREAKLRQLLKRISRAHYNVNLRLNSSSTVAVFTERPSIGVTSLSNVAFEDARHEIPFTLWCNSTLGLLCHWMHGSRQQSGRSRLGITTLATLLTLDVRALTEAQLVRAERVFEALKYRRLLPFNECAEDEVRHELDRCLLSEVLGLTDAGIIMFIDSLRKKLCAEPSIHGGKLSRCDLDAELAKLKQKGIPFPSWYVAGSA